MKKINRYVVAATLIFASSPLFAQRVKVSNNDPRWGEKITVTYTAPDTSQFAWRDNIDTLFCAATVKGSLPEHTILSPMHRAQGNEYESSLTIPDSTSSIQIQVCVPTATQGFTEEFTCRTTDGKRAPGTVLEFAANIDSALDIEFAMYPKHYSAYALAYYHACQYAQAGLLKMDDSAWKPFVNSLITRLKNNPDNSPSWHIILASLYQYSDNDSLSFVELKNAAKSNTYDPIFNDRDFWGHYRYPSMKKGGGISFSYVPGRIIAPLLDRYPHSKMAATWLQTQLFDTLLPTRTFRNVIGAWESSNDVDVLFSIARAYGFVKGPMYDPVTALVWCNRAETNSRNKAGFYSGENIYGSMDRLPGILALKVQLLAAIGKIDEATAVEHEGLQIAKKQYEKQALCTAMAKAYLDAGRIDDAKQAYGIALAMSTSGQLDGLKDLYAKCKEGPETIQEFSKRLTDTYGNTVQLPTIPDFSYTTLDGTNGTLAGLRGKVVVLDCWFISCPGCEIEKNSLNKLVESFHGDTNVVFLSIATDGETALRHYLEHAESKFKIVPNGYGICQKIGVNGFPTHIIIGRDGKTLGFEMGGGENEGDMMRPKIEQALGKM